MMKYKKRKSKLCNNSKKEIAICHLKTHRLEKNIKKRQDPRNTLIVRKSRWWQWVETLIDQITRPSQWRTKTKFAHMETLYFKNTHITRKKRKDSWLMSKAWKFLKAMFMDWLRRKNFFLDFCLLYIKNKLCKLSELVFIKNRRMSENLDLSDFSILQILG